MNITWPRDALPIGLIFVRSAVAFMGWLSKRALVQNCFELFTQVLLRDVGADLISDQFFFDTFFAPRKSPFAF